MALIVEDGTGKTDSDSYISRSGAKSYVDDFATTARNVAWDKLTNAQKDRALRTATQWLDGEYNTRWKGTRSNETQALDWPRQNIEDVDEFVIASTVIPTELERATVEMAMRAGSEDILGDDANDGRIKREMSKVGPLETETEYVGSASQQKKYRVVERLLRDLVTGSSVVTIFRR